MSNATSAAALQAAQEEIERLERENASLQEMLKRPISVTSTPSTTDYQRDQRHRELVMNLQNLNGNLSVISVNMQTIASELRMMREGQ